MILQHCFLLLECSKEFIRTTGKYECKKWLLDENSTVISLMSTDQDDGDCLYRMIISMVSLSIYLYN